MELNWIRAIGAGFDIAISVAACGFIGYYVCGGRLHQATPLSILGLAIGVLLGFIIAIYSIIRMFGGEDER